MDQFAVGMLSVFGLPPVEFVDLAADLGCHYVSAALQGMPLVPLGYPRFSLTDDAGLRNNLLAAMRDRGVSISLGDGFLVLPGADMRAFRRISTSWPSSVFRGSTWSASTPISPALSTNSPR